MTTDPIEPNEDDDDDDVIVGQDDEDQDEAARPEIRSMPAVTRTAVTRRVR